MKITKFGHCCLLIEENGVRILTDPGMYSSGQDNVKNIDIVLITHDHQDHLHIDSLKKVLENNPQVKIITNKSVGELLNQKNISYEAVEDGQSFSFKNVLIEAFGKEHAIIYSTLPSMANTGYFINNKLFYPGDAFTNPGKPVDILALPVAGPWTKLSDAINYAKEINPKQCFPIHDGILKSPGASHTIPPPILESVGIKFIVLEIDKEVEV
ncbi:MAG: Beta-lactamase domain protein [Candidatus Magasanikbacteria bacterium GW2011_GWA2_37_8]|uniref:Beta-lactamase domain protein n=1 Tax=Candidatus Magasanikbacteria bacterium GW2011_GWA2_37_8 TaxID=1619036 RepID=A0A0G0HAH6_9BACT|nr:MAG: Beta-lactamase domain protein [Candidatus Magasanikbacteria bacterium GW2011_GWA2_37_8]